MDYEPEHINHTDRTPQHDALTGLYTCAAFKEAAGRELPSEGGVLALLDIDHFHAINMRCGHAQGDKLLHETALALRELFFSGELLGRAGGDCFAVFAPGGSCGVIYARAAQLAGRLEEAGIYAEVRGSVTFACGVTERHGAEPFEDVWKRAQRLLKENKSGRSSRRTGKTDGEYRMDADLVKLRSALREKNPPRGAMYVDFESFRMLCYFIERRRQRVKELTHLLLLTLTDPQDRFVPLESREELMMRLKEDIQISLRASDVCTRSSACQYLILVLGATGAQMGVIAGRITARFTAHLAPDSPVALRADIAPLDDQTI